RCRSPATSPASGPGRGTTSARRWPVATPSTTGPRTPPPDPSGAERPMPGATGPGSVEPERHLHVHAVERHGVVAHDDLLLLDPGALDVVHCLARLGDAGLHGVVEPGRRIGADLDGLGYGHAEPPGEKPTTADKSTAAR